MIVLEVGVGMVVCMDGRGYHRCVWACACYNRDFIFSFILEYFNLEVHSLSVLFFFFF